MANDDDVVATGVMAIMGILPVVTAMAFLALCWQPIPLPTLAAVPSARRRN